MANLGTYYYAIPVVDVAQGKNGAPHRLARTQLQGPNLGDVHKSDPNATAQYMTVKYAGCSDSGVVAPGQGHIYYRGIKAMKTNGEKDSQWECITVESGDGNNVVIAEADYSQTNTSNSGNFETEAPYMDFMVTSAKGDFSQANIVRVEYDNADNEASWNKVTDAAGNNVAKMRRVTVLYKQNFYYTVSSADRYARTELEGDNVAAVAPGAAALGKTRYYASQYAVSNIKGMRSADLRHISILYKGIKASGSQYGDLDSQWESIAIQDGEEDSIMGASNYPSNNADHKDPTTTGLSERFFPVKGAKGMYKSAKGIKVEYDNDGKESWNPLRIKKFRRVSVVY